MVRVLVCLLLATACGTEDPEARVVPALPASTVATLGPAGGTVEFNTGVLTVPAGALSSNIDITIAVMAAAPEGHVGEALSFEPEGIVFDLPATLALYFEPADLPATTNAADLRIGVIEQGNWLILPESVPSLVPASVDVDIRVLAPFGVVPLPTASPACFEHTDCPAFMECWQGRCEMGSA